MSNAVVKQTTLSLGDLENEEKHWWLSDGFELFNGVFQGGGAKGIAYVGALQAFEKESCWFGAVAGSSAGALTATLVAAGMHSDDLKEETLAGLASIRKPAWTKRWSGHSLAALGGDEPLYPTDELRTWIEGLLRGSYERFMGTSWASFIRTQPERRHGDVTFMDLWHATTIDLFVVGLDVSGRVPIVLSHYSAPDCQVSSAAVASSSIPVLMQKKLLVVPDRSTTWRVVEIVDGGGWANYPRFVFDDRSFGLAHGIDEATLKRAKVGFVLTPQLSATLSPGRRAYHFVERSAVKHRAGDFRRRARGGKPQAKPAHDESQTGRMRSLGLITLGLLLPGIALLAAGSLPRAWKIGVWVFAAICFVIAAALARKALKRAGKGVFLFGAQAVLVLRVLRVFALVLITTWLGFGIWAVAAGSVTDIADVLKEPDAGLAFFFVLILAMAVLSVTCAAVLALAILFRFNRFLAEDAVPTFDASLGAATRVPDWLGWDPDADYVLRVPVRPRLETTDFDLDDERVKLVVRNARRAVRRQVRRRKAGEDAARPRPAPLPPAPLELRNNAMTEAERELRDGLKQAGLRYVFSWPYLIGDLLSARNKEETVLNPFVPDEVNDADQRPEGHKR